MTNDLSILSPGTQERGLAEHAHAELADKPPMDCASGLAKRARLADQQHGPAAWPKDPIPFPEGIAIERCDGFRLAQLLAKRWIADDAVCALIRQRQRPRIPAEERRLSQPPQVWSGGTQRGFVDVAADDLRQTHVVMTRPFENFGQDCPCPAHGIEHDLLRLDFGKPDHGGSHGWP